MYGLLLTDADASPPGSDQLGENVVGGGCAIEEIQPPARDDGLDRRLAEDDLRRGRELLKDVPQVEEFVDRRPQRLVVQGRPEQGAHLGRAVGQRDDGEVGALRENRHDIGQVGEPRGVFSASATGMLLCQGGGVDEALSLAWVDPDGKPLTTVGDVGDARRMFLSPAPDSSQIVYAARRNGTIVMARRPAGTRRRHSVRVSAGSGGPTTSAGHGVARDVRGVLRKGGISRLPLTATRSGARRTATALVSDQSAQNPDVSRDGRWVAYQATVGRMSDAGVFCRSLSNRRPAPAGGSAGRLAQLERRWEGVVLPARRCVVRRRGPGCRRIAPVPY